MGLFSRKAKGEATVSALAKGKGGRCPHCGADLQPIVNKEAQPVYEVFARMGPLAGNMTIDVAREQVIKQGLACSCGKKINTFAK